MSFANPTSLRFGMNGTLAGRRYRVAGRVVMGMEDSGETYYWNEFNLVTDEGESAALVYEETERGAEWRMFKLFEPEYPITAADAATKNVGDPLNLDGTDVQVTLVDESRVYHIGGEAPEGVEVGDEAHYFNAEAGNTMQVASWTGDEVEVFRGINLPRSAVESAFGLRTVTSDKIASSFLRSEEPSSSSPSGFIKKIIGAALGLAILFVSYSSCRPMRQRAAVTKTSALASPLVLGSMGKLDGKSYRIRGHAVVEIAQVGQLYDRHEYYISDEDANRALLVYGTKLGAKDWLLFTPLQPLTPLTPQQAAALRVGEPVNLAGFVVPVSEIFQATIRQIEYQDIASPDAKNRDVFYGFATQAGPIQLLARWNDSGITFYRGKALPTKAVTAAFSQKTRN